MADENKKQQMDHEIKNSLVLSGLVGTAGLFVAKLLGLLYSIPLSSILGSDALMSYYGTSYQIYSYVLNVFTAGVPFAISTIVAKYTVLNDNHSLRIVKKVSMSLMQIMGACGMILLVLLSGMIAKINAQNSGDVEIMATSLRILALAIFLVPILSSYRGFWQGRKEMAEYAFSQTFEQLFRVGFLLTAAYLIVYVFHMERRFALYAAVLSTSVAAVAAIIQIKLFDRKHIHEIRRKGNHDPSKDSHVLLKELVVLAIPYLLTSMIGYCDEIFNSVLLPIGLRMHGYSTDDYVVIMSAVNYVGNKLTSIPQILAPGFVTALIPHVTEAMTENNRTRISKIVTECIGIVFFIGSAVSACIAIYAADIYHILFYTSNPVLSASVVRWIAIEGFLGTICPVTSSLMIALGLKKDVLKRQLISAVIKGATMIPLIYLIGFRGAVVSSIFGNVYIFVGNIHEISKTYEIDLTYLLRNFGKIVAALLVMFAASYGLRMIGIDGSVGRKLAALGMFMLNVILAMAVYFSVSQWMKIPQELFHKDILSVLKARLKRNRNRQQAE
jgi:O-antigen/teichoic acid export membrane protein